MSGKAQHHRARSAPTEGTIEQGRAILVLGLGTLISHGFGLALVPAMLPRISADLGVGYGVLGAAVAGGLVAYSIGAVTTGWLLDRLPTRVALLGSFAVSAVGLVIAGAATSPAWLAIAVIVTGFVAPLSWAVTIHVIATTSAPNTRAAVMASAAGGAALGVLINGVLVQTSESIHTWRVSFVIAASIALVPIVTGLAVYRSPITQPSAGGASDRRGFRTAFAKRAGRVVVFAGLMAGIAGFPFNVFLTATAIDEMRVSSFAAGALWWFIGILGMAAGPILGRYADRTTPLQALMAGALMYSAGLAVLVFSWNYVGLLVAAVGYAFMNYPIWGLVGAIANQHFAPGLAVRSVSLGLVAASLGGAVGNAITGPWIDATASFRWPVAAMAIMSVALVAWYHAIGRDGALEETS